MLSPELEQKLMRRRSKNQEALLEEGNAPAANHRMEIEALRSNGAKAGRRNSKVQQRAKQFSGDSIPVTLEAAQSRDRQYRDQQLEQEKKTHQLHAAASGCVLC